MSIKTKNPLFNSSLKTFLDTASIEVLCSTPNSRIYYTIDGTTPSRNSSYVFSGNTIVINTVGQHIIKCFATSTGELGVANVDSDEVSTTVNVIKNINFDIDSTTNVYMDRQSYELEPVNSNGAQLYVDLTQFLPDKLINQDGFMEFVYMFQDYMNNGFRLIPKPCKTITYENKLNCGNSSTTTVEWLEPYDHDISMLMDYENNSQDIVGNISIEQYDRNRDISTFSIEENKLIEYKRIYSNKMTRGKYYDNYVYYRNLSELLKVLPEDANNYHIFMSSLDTHNDNISDIQCLTENKEKLHDYLKFYSGKLIANLYFCSYEDFESTFTHTGSFSLQDTFYPTFEGIVDNYNQGVSQNIKVFTNKLDLKNYLIPNTKRFRVSVLLDNIDEILSLTNINSEMSVSLIITNKNDINVLPSKCQMLAPRFKIIYAWQDPITFYEYFKSENDNRIDDKRSSILEKIHKIAYLKDPSVIDYQFIEFIASQMGYDIDIEREDIEGNSYYNSMEDKENALREILRNLPNFYKIKCTKNGLEALLLSFGIVGEVIYLYTIGNEKQEGYADFINSELIEGSYDSDIFSIGAQDKLFSNKTVNVSLSSSVISDWFPSPHFRIELDLLKQNLKLDANKLGIQLINKAVKKTKPINTVFQGFYGKMVANFGYMFIHKPKGLMRGYSLTGIGESCSTIDVWNKYCN